MKNTTLATILALSVLTTPAVSFGATKYFGPCYAYLGLEPKGEDKIIQVNCVQWGSDARHSREEAEQDRSKYLQQKAEAKAKAENAKLEAEKAEFEKQAQEQSEIERKVNEAVEKELLKKEEQTKLEQEEKQAKEQEEAKKIAELTTILQSLILQLAELKAKLGVQ